MPKGATLDGGDVVFYDDRFLVGISTRTNQRAVFLLIRPINLVSMSNRCTEDTLHLTTVCSSPRRRTIMASVGYLKRVGPLIR